MAGSRVPTVEGRDPGTLTTDFGGAGAPTGELELELDARYTAGDELGRGGGGRVLRAEDRRLGRPVALKIPIADHASSRVRLEREARVMARLEHPAIVPVHDAGRLTDGTPYYAMKLLGGRTLRDVVRAAATLDERIVLVPHVLAVAEAIAYAHSRRVIHRDLKPANVLIGEFGETVVIDWGLAKDLGADDPSDDGAPADLPPDARTITGAVIGTPHYMPPEQARGETVDERADVYALGAMLYDVLAGAPPYRASDSASVVAQLLDGPPPPLARVVADVPPELLAIVERAMARDRDDRYRTAIELVEDLRRYLSGRLVAAHHYSAAALVRRWVRRHRGAVAIGALALVAVGAIAVIAARRVVDERDRAETERDRAQRARASAEAERAGAEELIDFMLYDLRDRLKPIGKLDALGGVGDKVEAYYRAIARDDDRADPATLRRRGRALSIVADVAAKRGDRATAWTAAGQVLALDDRLVPRGDPDDVEALAGAWLRMGDLDETDSRIDDARATYAVALGIVERMARRDPASTRWAYARANVHSHLGRLADDRGDEATKTAEYAQVHVVLAPLVARGVATEDMEALLAVSTEKLADASYNAGRYDDAQRGYEEELALRKAILAAHPDDAHAKRGVAQTTEWIGMTEMYRNQLDAADADYRAAGAVFAELTAQDPDNVDWLRDNGQLHAQRARVLEDRGDRRGALAEDEIALDIAVRVAALAKGAPDRERDVGMSWVDVGEAHVELGEMAAAEKAYRTALAMLEQVGAHDPDNDDWAADRGVVRVLLARVLGPGAETRRLAAEAHAILDALHAKGVDNPEVRDLAERLTAIEKH